MASKAAVARRLQGKKKHHKFSPPWLKDGREPNGKVDPVPEAVRRRLEKKYGHGKRKK